MALVESELDLNTFLNIADPHSGTEWGVFGGACAVYLLLLCAADIGSAIIPQICALFFDVCLIAFNISVGGWNTAYAVGALLHSLHSAVAASYGSWQRDEIVQPQGHLAIYLVAEAIELTYMVGRLEGAYFFVAAVCASPVFCLLCSMLYFDEEVFGEEVVEMNGGLIVISNITLIAVTITAAVAKGPLVLVTLLPEVPLDVIQHLTSVSFEGGVGVYFGRDVSRLALELRDAQSQVDAALILDRIKCRTRHSVSIGGEYCWAGKWSELARRAGVPGTIVVRRKEAYVNKLFSHRPKSWQLSGPVVPRSGTPMGSTVPSRHYGPQKPSLERTGTSPEWQGANLTTVV